MQITHQITLSRDEWNYFETTLNRYNPEREERATAFLMGGAGSQPTETGESIIIDMPDLSEEEVLKLLGLQRDDKDAVAVFQYDGEMKVKASHEAEVWFPRSRKETEKCQVRFPNGSEERNEYYRQAEEPSLKCA